MSVPTKRSKTNQSILLGAMLAALALSSCGSKSDGDQGQANPGVSGDEDTKAATISSDDVMKLCPQKLKEMFVSDIETVKEKSPETFSRCEGKSLEVSYAGEKAAYLNDAYVTLVSYSLSCGQEEVFMGMRGINKDCLETAYGKVKNEEGEEGGITTSVSAIEGSFTISYSNTEEKEQTEEVVEAVEEEQTEEVVEAEEEEQTEEVVEAEEEEQTEAKLPKSISTDVAGTSPSGACREDIEKEVKSLLEAEATSENCAYNKAETKVSYARVTAGLENVSVISFKASCEGNFKTQVGYIGMDSECKVSKITEVGIEKEKFNAQAVAIEE